MATIYFEGYMGTTQAWTDIGANTLVFSASLTDLATAITVAEWQDGTHAGSDDPGTDQCGANHMNNVKYISSNQMQVNGGATELINDTNLVQNECTLRIHFNHSSSVAVTGARLFCYDGSVYTNEGIGIDMYGFEQGEAASAWTQINDDSGNIGGDNAGQRLDLVDSAAALDHYWYVAVSASPESVGDKTSFDLGVTLTYS